MKCSSPTYVVRMCRIAVCNAHSVGQPRFLRLHRSFLPCTFRTRFGMHGPPGGPPAQQLCTIPHSLYIGDLKAQRLRYPEICHLCVV